MKGQKMENELDVIVEFEKPKMISLAEQRKRDKERQFAKIMTRRMKNPPTQRVAPIVLGNKNSGVPFTGKDRFSGQNLKFADRVVKNHNGLNNGVDRVFVFDNNKYDGQGKLKD
jgi:epoxyqueuosine reductase QueG